MNRFPLLLTASLGALIATGALAQDDDRMTFLGTLVLSGTENPTAPLTGAVAKASATSKTGTPILQLPASVSVIPRAQIEATGATTVAKALTYSAGVVAENYGSDPRFDSLYLRGFNLENDKFLDGLRLMRSTQYPTSAPAFEIYGLERIEILRGPASVLYGAGTPAGVANMVQKRAQADGDFSEVGVSTDSRGSYALMADANRVVDDRFAYRITGKVGTQKTDVEGIDKEGGYLGLSASYQLTEATELEVMASRHDDAPISPTGVPNAFTSTYDLDALRSFDFADEGVNDSDRQMTTLGFGLTHDFGNGWKLNGTYRHTEFDWTYHSVYIAGASGATVSRGVITQVEDFTADAFDLRLAGSVQTGAIDHDLTLGLDAQRFSEAAFTGFSTTSAIDYASPSYGGLTYGAPWYRADKTVDATQVGLYALDEMKMGDWRATLGLRHDVTDQTGQNATNFGTTSYDRSDAATTGQASIAHVWGETLTTYASYATSFLPQAGFDIDGNKLKPTHGRQTEAGVKWAPDGMDALFTAAVYDLRETDRNTSVTRTVGAGTITGTEQIGEARIQGLELEATGALVEGWTGKAAYTFTRTEISGDNDGNELANTPEHAASVWLDHQVTERLSLGGGLRHIGARWSSDANTTRLEAVTLADFGAAYAFDNGMSLRLNVSNLADTAYVSAVGYSSSYIGDGRVVSASLSYKW